ncbi:Arabinose 5-phosphate isomerase KdsD [Neolewinella maritima]|uniref:Arabinose 5-phosphate isomerase KdsD n=1 Tax=Neolewinella maritima TaxID=1383882 RepID=A0ABN8F7W5_9BACT|nr:KpsF/GutQ family sugar-phosphate isomerase [Neolewinella maritima]CAH1001374.1 Arabinose 5-phosphate isomerase KdsD [Neolewinella maritima]
MEDLIQRTARETLSIEAEALSKLAASIGDDFRRSVEAIHEEHGRIIVTGVGKTALVAQKIVATLNSTGSPAFFLHAGDAIHGDIGMVQPTDVVLALSRSGETAEIELLALLVRNLGNTLIAMTSAGESTLARRADHLLLVPFEREADPNGLAPTTSTTLMMAMGDALATSLLALRGFSTDDFARFHPGGALGKQLYLRVDDLYRHNAKPSIYPTASLKDTLLAMTTGRLGATAVVDRTTDKFLGIITDGDIRRLLNARRDIDQLTAQDIMTPQPRCVRADALVVQAASLMQENSISQLIVLNEHGIYLGMIHIHDIVREGLI